MAKVLLPSGDASRVAGALLLLALALLGTSACQPRSDHPPTLRIESPQDGVEVSLGERVLVQSVAQDDKGVVKTELWVDGRLYQVERAANARGEPTLNAIQIWTAASLGRHRLVVKAHDAGGRVSEPVSVTVMVVPPPPTPTPFPTPPPTVAANASCKPSARFVEDVTVPDDSLFNGGARFTKVWRMRNDGDCRWEPGTRWVFISGDLLGAQSPVDVELAEPGRIVEISVDMVAPTTPGTYKSYWRLQRPNGEFFGDQAYVRIIVP